MGKNTSIAWTDHTFNITIGCAKVSEGCQNCYAETQTRRFPAEWGITWGELGGRKILSPSYWRQPVSWNREAELAGVRRRVFCSSLCDVFEDHPVIDQERARLWPLLQQTPWLDWLLLTKRSDRVTSRLPLDWGNGYPNVWLGVSIENNRWVSRADDLRRLPAAVRFISAEPLLGPLDGLSLEGIDWLIVGGESGAKHRPMEHDWARSLRDRCQAAGVAFFFKQSAGLKSGQGRLLDGSMIEEVPAGRIALPLV